MISDPIIEDLHAVREKIYNESKSQESLKERHKDLEIPAGMKRANLKPAKIDWNRLEPLKAGQ